MTDAAEESGVEDHDPPPGDESTAFSGSTNRERPRGVMRTVVDGVRRRRRPLRSLVESVGRRRDPLPTAVWLLRRQLVVSLAVFALCAILGYVFLGPVAVEAIQGSVRPDCRTPTAGPVSATTLGYFTNNAGVAIVLIGGMGVLTIGALAYNGLLMGAAWSASVGLGASNGLVAACVLPHGLIEFPALWLAGAIGVFLPWRLGRWLGGRRDRILDPNEEANLVQLVALVLALLLVAAFVEANVSEAVTRLLLGPP